MLTMKIGVQTAHTIDALGIDGAFDAYRAAGFDCVDLNLDDRPKISWNELRDGVEDPFFASEEGYMPFVNAVNAASKRTGVKIGQVHAPFPLGFRGLEKANERGLRWAKTSIEICRLFDCDKIVIHPLFDGSLRQHPTTRDEEFEMNIPFYSALIPLLRKYHIICCLENMWAQDWQTKKIYSTVCSDMSDACKYIDRLNEIAGEKLFGFCLDIGHLALCSLDNYDAIRELGDRLVTLHIHDNQGGIDDNHVIPYMGIIYWERFIRGLADAGYNGTLSFETAGQYRKVPTDLLPTMLNWTADIGRYFDKRIAEIRSGK